MKDLLGIIIGAAVLLVAYGYWISSSKPRNGETQTDVAVAAAYPAVAGGCLVVIAVLFGIGWAVFTSL